MPNERLDAHAYVAARRLPHSMDDTLPGKFEITMEGVIHDATAPNRPHELTVLRIRQRLESVIPEDLVAHAGTPDVEDETEQILRRPDVIVIAESDMAVEGGSFNPRTLIAAIEVVSHSNPDNDWVSKMSDYPLLGIPAYAIFDRRTDTGAVLTDIHPTPEGPRYA